MITSSYRRMSDITHYVKLQRAMVVMSFAKIIHAPGCLGVAARPGVWGGMETQYICNIPPRWTHKTKGS